MLNKDFHTVFQKEVFQTLARCVENLSLESYLVGGFVRDHLLGRVKAKDIDVVAVDQVLNWPGRFKKNCQVQKQSKFLNPMALLWYNGEILADFGREKESYSKESRNPQITKGTLEDDQNRRDFTINTLAVSLNAQNKGTLIDPFNGLEDLQNGIIRTPMEPVITYSDDPAHASRRSVCLSNEF